MIKEVKTNCINTNLRKLDTRLNELITVEDERRDAMTNFLNKQAVSQVEA